MSGHRASPRVLPATISSIVLTGFMGAGKTTVGELLAAELGWRFADTDRVVEERAGMTVGQIFEIQGEAAFRDLESAAIQSTASGSRLVVALGGGALERADNREFLAGLAGCRVVFLEAPLETLLSRCARQAEGPVRPVLRDRQRLMERWQARLPLYRQAHLTIATSDRTPRAVVESVLAALIEPDRATPRAPMARGVHA